MKMPSKTLTVCMAGILILTTGSCRLVRPPQPAPPAPPAQPVTEVIQGRHVVNHQQRSAAPRNTSRPQTSPPKTDPYSSPTRGLRNAPVSIPRVVPPGSATTYNRVSGVPGKFIAMTYDDGPHPTHTPRLLDMLKQRNIKATFYVVGKNANLYPSIMRRIVREGHEVGNHTWNHPNMNKISKDRARKELIDSSEAIFKATGVRPRTMRPPGGALTTANRNWVRSEFGYPTILWSVDPRDWADRHAPTVTRRLIQGATAGGILLAHDIHKTTIDAMPNTLDGLLQRGFSFVTVSQLINMGSSANAPRSYPQPGPQTQYVQQRPPQQVRPMPQPMPRTSHPAPAPRPGITPSSPNPSWNGGNAWSPYRFSWQPR